MTTSLQTQPNFRALTERRQHKIAADALRAAFETDRWDRYRTIERYLTLSQVEPLLEEVSDRYHMHLNRAGIATREHNLLIRHTDTASSAPYLPIAIYLENLRSAHNVGSIFRTTEALRLGTIHLSPQTPTPDNKKVRDASMGTTNLVPYTTSTIENLPRPLIALETTAHAQPLHSATFPETFSLLLGNEEYGLSAATLSQADMIIEIPLRGTKNSLNVANAFAITAAHIAHTHLASASFGNTNSNE
jgi:tRNA G18 (ribose-2'-O)-methylase SpoU